MTVKLLLLTLLPLAAAGCGGGSDAVTDPSKLKPLTADELKGMRAADDAVAAEEHANPTQPKKGQAR